MAAFGSPARIGVSMVPGPITFARILRSFNSIVQVRTNERMDFIAEELSGTPALNEGATRALCGS